MQLMRRVERGVRVLERYHRARVDGLATVPDGPALFVGNHSAGMATPDSYLFAARFYRHTGFTEPLLFLGHSLVTTTPGIGHLTRLGGGIEATRGNAAAHLSAGHKVMVYPGGDWEATRPSRDRDRIDFGGRKGFVRTALKAGVPIVPVVTAGGHDGWYVLARGARIARALRLERLRLKVFPIAVGAPFGLMLGPATVHLPLPVRILIRALPPIHLAGDPDDPTAIEAGYALVTGRMQAALTELARELRAR